MFAASASSKKSNSSNSSKDSPEAVSIEESEGVKSGDVSVEADG